MKRKLISFIGFGGMLMPFLASAQVVSCNSANVDINYIICRIAVIINAIIPLLIALGVVYFIYGVITYVISKDEEAKKRGKDAMIYGLIGLLVIVSIWGLIAIVKNTFGVNTQQNVQIPCIPNPALGVTC